LILPTPITQEIVSMTRSIMLASVLGIALAGPAMAQGATGGGGSGGGGGGAVVESPQPGQMKTPTGTSSKTPGMATPTAHAKKTTKQPAAHKPAPVTGMNEPPVNGVRPVAAEVGGASGSK
jgi:hypothetical protein